MPTAGKLATISPGASVFSSFLSRPVVKVLPREGQLQGINSPQTSADCRTSCHGQQRPPTAPQLRHQRLPVDNNQRLEQASHSAELLIRTRPRTRDGTATPPKWPVGSLCSSFPHSAGPLPEQSFKYKQPPPCADSCAVAVSDSLPFSAGQAKVQRVLPRPRHLSADPAGQGCYQHGFVKHWKKSGQIAGKDVSDRSTGRQSALHQRQRPQRGHIAGRVRSQRRAAKKYSASCRGITRGSQRGPPQAVGAYRKAQRPESAHRALQKVMSVETRRHRKDNM